jgi:hypothetical protein
VREIKGCGADNLDGFRNVETLTNGRYLTA